LHQKKQKKTCKYGDFLPLSNQKRKKQTRKKETKIKNNEIKKKETF